MWINIDSQERGERKSEINASAHHFAMKEATTIAPGVPSSLSLKSALVMELSIVAG